MLVRVQAVHHAVCQQSQQLGHLADLQMHRTFPSWNGAHLTAIAAAGALAKSAEVCRKLVLALAAAGILGKSIDAQVTAGLQGAHLAAVAAATEMLGNAADALITAYLQGAHSDKQQYCYMITTCKDTGAALLLGQSKPKP